VTDGPDFDFVVGPDDLGDEEELPGAREPRPPRRGIIAAVLVAAALAVLVVVHAAWNHHARPTASPPTPGPALPTAAYRPSRPAPAQPTPASSSPAPFRGCPATGPAGCVVSHRVSARVMDAILARFPRAHGFRQLDVELHPPGAGSRLYYREIHARINGVQLSITVSRRPLKLPEEIGAEPGVLSYSYYSRRGLHVTTVGVALGLRWRLPPAARMFALTADPRLCAPTPPVTVRIGG